MGLLQRYSQTPRNLDCQELSGLEFVILAREQVGEPGEIGFEVTVGSAAFLVRGVVCAVSLKPCLPVLGCVHGSHDMTTFRHPLPLGDQQYPPMT